MEKVKIMKTNDKAPYKELDRNIVKLVRALNSFDGIRTVGSCGGHPNPKASQQPEGEWFITFMVDHTDDGWFALEFLTWFINNNMARNGCSVMLMPYAFPPFINIPGEALYFAPGGSGIEANWLAKELKEAKETLYVTPADMDALLEEEVEAA
jgi:hypothetical protein